MSLGHGMYVLGTHEELSRERHHQERKRSREIGNMPGTIVHIVQEDDEGKRFESDLTTGIFRREGLLTTRLLRKYFDHWNAS